jgi:tRNA threonylcarbamoyladenosine biosynthesis protein TsaB
VRLLALDTATEACSVALLRTTAAAASLAGAPELLVRELEPGRGASELILGMVREVLAEAELHLGDLDAIAFGRGPGGFTGVRLAASVVQGLAFGAGLPVIPVSDLAAVALRALDAAPAAAAALVCNDARMQEVYWTCCVRDGSGLVRPAAPERVGPPDTVVLPVPVPAPVVGAGRGFSAYPQLAQRLGAQLQGVLPDLLPRAREIVRLAGHEFMAGRVLTAEAALPVYLRDDIARPAASHG